MRQYDDRFLELYNQYGTNPSQPDQKGDATTYTHVMEKIGIKPCGRRRLTKLLLIAAVVATAGLTAAAAYYSVSDAFRGVLSAPETPDGQASASVAPVIEKSGLLLDGKAESGGIQVSLRAAVGDERSIKLLVDVVDTSGKPLALTQSDGELSGGRIQFANAALEMLNHPRGYTGHTDEFGVFHGNVSGGYGDTLIDSDPGDSRATFLMDFSVADAPVRGEKYRLHISDLLQNATMAGAPIGMGADAMSGLAAAFGDHTDADFRNNGYEEDENGNVTYSYELIADSGKAIPLCEKTPGIQVTNAAIYKGILHLRGTAESAGELKELLDQCALVNPATGDVKPWASSGTGEDDGKYTWTASFRDITTAEELKGYAWYTGYGEGDYPVAEGNWQLEFTLDYENTTRTAELARELNWQGHGLTAGKLELSPFSAYLELTCDAATMEKLVPTQEWGTYRPRSDWEKSDRALTITMKDGTAVTAAWPGGTSYVENTTGYFQLVYALDTVIDPEQVAKVTIFDETVDFQP